MHILEYFIVNIASRLNNNAKLKFHNIFTISYTRFSKYDNIPNNILQPRYDLPKIHLQYYLIPCQDTIITDRKSNTIQPKAKGKLTKF